jgi:hypothetical protein
MGGPVKGWLNKFIIESKLSAVFDKGRLPIQPADFRISKVMFEILMVGLGENNSLHS